MYDTKETPLINLTITKRDRELQCDVPTRSNQKFTKIPLRYFYQVVKPEFNQASSSNDQCIGNTGNRFKLVKCHHGDAISKIENMRDF